MKNENEVIMLILNVVVLIFTFFYKNSIKQVNGYKLLFSSFLLFLFASICTNLESLIFEEYLNFLEHSSYLMCVLIMFIWSYKHLLSKKNIIKYD